MPLQPAKAIPKHSHHVLVIIFITLLQQDFYRGGKELGMPTSVIFILDNSKSEGE